MTYVSLFDKVKFICFCGGYPPVPPTAPIQGGGTSQLATSTGASVSAAGHHHHHVTKHQRAVSSEDASPSPVECECVDSEEGERCAAAPADPVDDKREGRNKRQVSRRKKNVDIIARQHKYRIYDDVASMGERYNITILPVYAGFCIENLYPETNQVHKWNIIIIGKDKTFIHVSVHDLDLPQHETFPNRRSGNVLDRQLQDFFDPIFDKTLMKHQLQFIMAWSQRIFLVNTYPICNQVGGVIGAVIFIRNYNLMPKMTFAVPLDAGALAAAAAATAAAVDESARRRSRESGVAPNDPSSTASPPAPA